MTAPFAVDYDAVRVAFINAMRNALQLGQQQVIMEQPEVANSPRPRLPYLGILNGTPSQRYGWDVHDVAQTSTDAAGSPVFTSTTTGPRSTTITFTSYAETHEESYGLMATWQAHLDTVDVQAYLRQHAIAVWTIGDVEDVSALLNTGYEGRAQMVCIFGVLSSIKTTSGSVIGSVVAAGSVSHEQSTAEVVATVTGD